MSRPKKKFRDTVVGKLAGGAISLFSPTLGNLITGTSTIEEALDAVKNANVPAEDKHRAQELLIQAYEAEVSDRISAREREAAVALAGGSDIMFKGVGFGVIVIWGFLLYALFFGKLNIPPDTMDLMQIAFGAVSSQMMAVVSYYFGASVQKK